MGSDWGEALAGRSDSLVRHAVLAGVVLSPGPKTRFSLGVEVGERFAQVFRSWDERHAYLHVRRLAADRLIVPTSARTPPRYLASPEGVATWRAWLVSPISGREPLREALARLRSCRDDDWETMTLVVDLLEEHMLEALERPAPPADSPLTVMLAGAAQRNSAMACVRWCQEARDEISARAAASR